MTQDQPSRLDRIEAVLEAMLQQMQQDREQRQQEYENQMRLNADVRTRQELQGQQIGGLIEVAETTLNSIQQLRDEFNQHRSDGHGA